MVSFSEINEFLHCPWRWDLKYQRGWEDGLFVPKRDLGSATHVGIEAVLKDEDPIAAIERWGFDTLNRYEDSDPDLQASVYEEVNAVVNQAMDLATRWRDVYMDWEEWETAEIDGNPAVEYKLEFETPGGTQVLGYLDWVARNKRTGGLYIVDWKTRDAFTNEESEQFNVQQAVYQYGLTQQGVDISGCALMQIRSSLPNEPKVNKNGTISRSACRTDWDTYKRVCIENGQDPEDYLEMKLKLDAYEWCRWTFIRRSERELLGWAWWIDDMIYAMGHASRRPSSNCSWCWARHACLEEMRDTDVNMESLGLVQRRRRTR